MTRTLTFTIAAEDAGHDLRYFVRRRLGLSARVLTALKYEGEMRLNGRHARSVDVLSAGDAVALALFDAPGDYELIALPLTVLWENEDFLVADKPAGMPVHPSPGHDRDSLLHAAAWYFRGVPDFVFRPLYRLDCDTTGAIVLAKNKFAAGAVLEKTYMAGCEGTPPESGVIDLAIGLKPGHTVERCTGIGARAVTAYRRIAADGAHSLMAFRLETGRTHQIRVHMAGIGHPVAGDDLYGGKTDRTNRQLLRCTSVRIVCPVLNTDKTVAADFTPAQKRLFPALFNVEREK